MANVVINDAHLNDIAAAIRAKNGSTDTYKPSEMAAAISAIEGSSDIGDTVSFDDYISRSLTGSIQVNCSAIGDYGLYGNKNMTSLTTTATTIGESGCARCISLTTVVMNNLISIGIGGFAGCQTLSSIQIPLCQTLSQSAFDSCKALRTFVAPSVTTVGTAVFSGCSNLTKIDFTNLSTVSSEAFIGATNLTDIIIRNTNAVPSAPNQGILPSKFRSDTTSTTKGYIYVPAAMMDAYASNSVWSILNYRAIEDYPEICG